MDSRAPARIIASCFALSAFAIALISGLAADRSTSAILSTAVFALFICYILGLVVAAVANVAISEHINQYKSNHPIPELNDQPGHSASSDSTEQASQAA
ncbi:MAG: hypothetical protein ACIAQF_01245 [Phycisphaerales bacterium JB065]